MATFAEAPPGDVAKGAKIFKTKVTIAFYMARSINDITLLALKRQYGHRLDGRCINLSEINPQNCPNCFAVRPVPRS
jgi:hypothetical protein